MIINNNQKWNWIIKKCCQNEYNDSPQQQIQQKCRLRRLLSENGRLTTQLIVFVVVTVIVVFVPIVVHQVHAESDFIVHVGTNKNLNTTLDSSSSSSNLLNIVFASCHKMKYYDRTIWDTIIRTPPLPTTTTKDHKNQQQPVQHSVVNGFLWLGDTIYPPYRGVANISQLEKEYNEMLTNQSIGYSNFVHYMNETTIVTSTRTRTSALQKNQDHKDKNNNAIFGVWDDHDYGGNDMGHTMTEKKERENLFWNFLQKERPSVSLSSSSSVQKSNQHRKGIYYSVEFRSEVIPMITTTTSTIKEDDDSTSTTRTRTIKVLFLDTRSNRISHCIPSVASIQQVPYGAGFACFTRWISAGLFPKYCTKKQQQNQQQQCDGDDNCLHNYNSSPLLGSDQWEWLQQELQSSSSRSSNSDSSTNAVVQEPPDLILLVSSIQVLTTNPVVESWGHYPKERTKLLKIITTHIEQTKQPILILSGDVHHAEILDPLSYHHHHQGKNKHNTKETTTSTPPTPSGIGERMISFLEVTSSALTHDCTLGVYGILCKPLLHLFSKHRYQSRHDNEKKKKNNNNQHHNYYIGRNYGTVQVNWLTHTYTVNIHKVENGEVVLTTGNLPLRPLTLPQQQQQEGETSKDESIRDNNAIVTSLVTTDSLTNNWFLWKDQDIHDIYSCMDGHLIPIFWMAVSTLLMMFLFLLQQYKRITTLARTPPITTTTAIKEKKEK